MSSSIGNTDRYSAPALEKGLDILELLAGEPAGLSQTDIARRMRRSPSEIFRMLSVLEARGYVLRKKPEDRYRLTLRLFDLAHRHPPTRRLLDAALPEMSRLAQSTGQSCHLAVMHDQSVLMIADEESPHPLGFAVKLGARFPLLTTTSGLVLLAHQPPETRAWILKLAARAVPTSRRGGLDARLDGIRAKGFEQTPSEKFVGITDISFPILDHTGIAIAALTMPYLTQLQRKVDLTSVRSQLGRAAQRISRAMGGRSGSLSPGRGEGERRTFQKIVD